MRESRTHTTGGEPLCPPFLELFFPKLAGATRQIRQVANEGHRFTPGGAPPADAPRATLNGLNRGGYLRRVPVSDVWRVAGNAEVEKRRGGIWKKTA
jgi:hypothetical protein